MSQWIEKDFKDKKNVKVRGFNVVLEAYANVRDKLMNSRTVYEDEDGEPLATVCCDGISGLFGLFFLLCADVAYVAYATYCNKLATEDDIRLVWLSAIVWFVILVKIFRRLVRLGKLRGGCFSPFVAIGDGVSSLAHIIWKVIKSPWTLAWKNVSGTEKQIRKKKSFVVKM